MSRGQCVDGVEQKDVSLRIEIRESKIAHQTMGVMYGRLYDDGLYDEWKHDAQHMP